MIIGFIFFSLHTLILILQQTWEGKYDYSPKKGTLAPSLTSDIYNLEASPERVKWLPADDLMSGDINGINNGRN